MVAYCLTTRLHAAVIPSAGLQGWTEKLAETAALEMSLLLGTDFGHCVANLTTLGSVAVATPFVFITILFDICWSFGFLPNFLFGLLFLMVFKAYLHVLEGHKCCEVVEVKISRKNYAIG